MKLCITGGCGFLGTNLAVYALQNDIELTIFDNLSRKGSLNNYQWLLEQGDFNYINGDIRNKNDVEETIKLGFDAVFHLAGQVAMTTSIQNPYKDFEINALGTLNLLDSIRVHSPETKVFYSSTNKVYGDLEQFHYTELEKRYVCDEYPNGFDEKVTLDFHSPYGCSKGSADQYMQDFYRIFNIETVVFRHSSMYGGRQFSSYDQGWIGWFCQKALERKSNPESIFTISGNGKQVRDILYADDMVNLYFSGLENIELLKGQAFNIGGTIEQSLSLLELFALLEELEDVNLEYQHLPVRESDQKVFVADITKINDLIGWKPQVSAREGIERTLTWLKK